VNITLPGERFAQAGLDAVKLGALGAGALDPLTVSLALQIHGAGAEGAAAAMYRDTLAGALAMHVGAVFAAKPAMGASALDDARLKRAQDLIEARLGEALSLDDLAASAGMSPFHFARAFKARTGLAPHQFLIARRIERAKVLLRTTALPIAEIAARVGWENAGKFAAQFKKLGGYTPGQWRAG
jgi:AraC family transcriptional regulator